MISFFKALNPLNILWLAVILFISRIGFILVSQDKTTFAFAEPVARLLISPGNFLNPGSTGTNILLAGIVVFAQALLLNHLVNHHNLLGKPTFLPALMYITLSGLFTPFLVLSPPLLCNFLIIWMLFKLFSFYKSNDAKSAAFDLGMMIAIGTIIYLPFIYFFLALCVALIIFRPLNWREILAGVVGYVTIFFFLAVYYYMNESLGQFYSIWLPLGTKFPDSINIHYYSFLVLVPVVVILSLCFVKLQQNFFKSYVQIRKSFQLLFVVFLIASLSFYVKTPFNLNHFLLCAVPCSVFFSYYFLYAKNKWFYESLYLLLLISIIYFQFNKF
ncbi:DUF6427 family protein [Mucilaginibacter xinganensis]|uniref:Beta-carotene 15,15'-monooxygenase n=1 Tax=Mucilaginibacter xinganensis TaxID=1234841 RepID=A0A223P1Y4_9SPHI|nr:DUF6427 family protein [Mucilaginibacter xinganensis]ASU36135.1 beta-carotene 15,15'-monooxygenase [Mucilaginibacter xinganensis]